MPEDLRINDHLRAYLLGGLPEEEVDRLERRLLDDDDLFELCEAVEGDLLAACDRGELTEAEREQVCRRLAFSPAGRERLALARSLNAAARESQRMASVVPFRRITAPTPRPRVRWAALAAAVLLMAVGAWSARRMLDEIGGPQKNQISKSENGVGTASEQPQTSLAQGPTAPQPQSGQDRPAPQPQTEPPPRRDEFAETTPEQPAPFVVALSLAALRSAEDVEQFRIPAGTEFVEVQFDLAEQGLEGIASFQAAVRNQEGETIWNQESLGPRKVDGILVLEIPVRLLPEGRYTVEVTAGTETFDPQFGIVREHG